MKVNKSVMKYFASRIYSNASMIAAERALSLTEGYGVPAWLGS